MEICVEKQRNYSIDILRTIAMVMVVTLHVLGQGGVLDQFDVFSVTHIFLMLFEIISYSCIDIFAMISGYVNYNLGKNMKSIISRLMKLWLQIVFYTVLITIIMRMLNKEVISTDLILNALFPISTRQYWYLTCFFILSLFSPLIDSAVKSVTQNTAKISFITILLMGVVTLIVQNDPFVLNSGYSVIWLILMYYMGGCIHRFEIGKHISRYVCFILIIISTLATLFIYYLIYWLSINGIVVNYYEGILLNYISPTTILLAVALLCLASKGGNDLKKTPIIIEWFTKTSLGVYCIHTNPLIFKHIPIISERYINSMTKYPIIKTVFMIIFIYLSCSFIDSIRIYLFNQFGVSKRVDHLLRRFRFLKDNLT